MHTAATARFARLAWCSSPKTTGPRAAGSNRSQHFWSHFTPPSKSWRERKRAHRGLSQLDDICTELGWMVGGPATVADELAGYARDCGLDALDVSFQVPGLAAAEANEAMILFAEEVMPRVRDAGKISAIGGS